MIRSPAATKKGGAAEAFPDVCHTPGSPQPVAYSSFGRLAIADRACQKVLCENKETVVDRSVIPASRGAEEGTGGGLVSGVVRGSVAFKRASAKVFAHGRRVVYHAAATSHNGTSANAPLGCHTVASQDKVLIST